MAESVQRALVLNLRKTAPAITDRGVKTAPFVVLVATEMPAIVAEVSSLSNEDDARRLNTAEYRQTIAEALVVWHPDLCRWVTRERNRKARNKWHLKNSPAAQLKNSPVTKC